MHLRDRELCVFIAKTSRLLMPREITAMYCENRMKHTL
jgi:hypothetical protein